MEIFSYWLNEWVKKYKRFNSDDFQDLIYLDEFKGKTYYLVTKTGNIFEDTLEFMIEHRHCKYIMIDYNTKLPVKVKNELTDDWISLFVGEKEI